MQTIKRLLPILVMALILLALVMYDNGTGRALTAVLLLL